MKVRDASWLVRLVLALCPPDVRGFDAEALTATLESRLREATRRGRGAVLALAAREVWAAGIEGARARLQGGARNLRHAVRTLSRRPALVVVIVLSFAVGIGATTAIFSVVRGVLLEPLPWPEPARLVEVRSIQPELGLEQGVSEPDFRDWQREVGGFEDLTAWYGYSAVLTTERLPMRLSVAYTAPNLFELLREEPVAGQLYRANPAGVAVGNMVHSPDGVVVLSYDLWLRLGGDPEIVGDTLTIDGSGRTVAGVLPRDAGILAPGVEAWLPWRMGDQQRNSRFLRVIGRLRHGVTPTAASRQLASVTSSLAETYPASNEGWGAILVPLRSALLGEVERPLWILLGAVLLVLLITCSNVATLLLARGRERAREVAVRVALGASRRQVVATHLVESTLLALLGALAGVLAARLSLDVLLSWYGELPRVSSVSVDAVVLLSASALAVAAGLLAGWMPARRAARVDPAGALRSSRAGDDNPAGAGGHLRARKTLLVAQVSVVVVLLCGAGLLLRSFVRLQGVSPGFDPGGVLVADLQLEPQAAATAAGRVELVDRVLERAAGLVGVESVGGVTVLPFRSGGVDFNRPYWRRDDPDPRGDAPKADIRMATPGYFRTLGITLLTGRDFEHDDRFEYGAEESSRRHSRSPVVIVNRSLAERTWPGRPLDEVVGRRLVMDYPGETYAYQIVGVVEDTRTYALDVAPRPEIFIPYAQNPYPGLVLALRFDSSTVDAPTLASSLAEAVADVDPSQPVHAVTTLSDLLASSLDRRRFHAQAMGALSGIAFLIALVGLYGLVSAGVRARTHEFGVRIALGARRGHLVGLAMADALRLAAGGMVAGLAAAAALSRGLEALLFGVPALDPVTFVTVPVLVSVVVGLASYLPARRTLAVEPSRSLKAE